MWSNNKSIFFIQVLYNYNNNCLVINLDKWCNRQSPFCRLSYYTYKQNYCLKVLLHCSHLTLHKAVLDDRHRVTFKIIITYQGHSVLNMKSTTHD